MSSPYAETEAELRKLGLPRTRENYLSLCYADFPNEWDDEAEEILPADLRLYPAPDTPFP